MSNLKNIILESNDLTTVMWQVDEWIDPDSGLGVILELRSPTVQRRQQIMRQYQIKNAVTGEAEVDLVDLQMALVLEMVFDPNPEKGEEDEALFSEEDRDALGNRNGTAMWSVAQECLRVAGFIERVSADGENIGTEQALVDEGKD